MAGIDATISLHVEDMFPDCCPRAAADADPEIKDALERVVADWMFTFELEADEDEVDMQTSELVPLVNTGSNLGGPLPLASYDGEG